MDDPAIYEAAQVLMDLRASACSGTPPPSPPSSNAKDAPTQTATPPPPPAAPRAKRKPNRWMSRNAV